MEEMMTATQVAAYLNISRLTVKRWAKKGKLPFTRISDRGDMRFKRSDVERLLENGRDNN